MLTIAQLPSDELNTVSNEQTVTHNETLPSDAEISKRVMRIRSSWSVEERVARKHEAELRFADLVCKLIEADLAA